MFGFTAKKKKGESVNFKISGMHCTSCALNIDGELEDQPGVLESKTNYARSSTEVVFDPDLVTKQHLKRTIEKLDYDVREL